MIIRTKKNKVTNKELEETINKMAKGNIVSSITQDLMEISRLTTKDLLTMISFIKYIIADDKNKIFATTPDTIIGKNKKTLEKNHNCKIRIIKIIKRI
jgi:Asp-tRNA(Asn)/Glu-tRNA(Gln) amidotransferase B subunit